MAMDCGGGACERRPNIRHLYPGRRAALIRALGNHGDCPPLNGLGNEQVRILLLPANGYKHASRLGSPRIVRDVYRLRIESADGRPRSYLFCQILELQFVLAAVTARAPDRGAPSSLGGGACRPRSTVFES